MRGKATQGVEQGCQSLRPGFPLSGHQAGPRIHDNRINMRVTVKDGEQAVQGIGSLAHPNRMTGIERVLKAATNDVKERRQFFVRGIAERGNPKTSSGTGIGETDRGASCHGNQPHSVSGCRFGKP